MKENQLATVIVDLAFQIHSKLGPGLFESVYEEIICHELGNLNLPFTRQHPIPVIWNDIKLGHGFRADIIVDNCVIIEIKSIEHIGNVHKKQLLTYLKLTNHKLGLLINFNEALIKHGITRIVNNL